MQCGVSELAVANVTVVTVVTLEYFHLKSIEYLDLKWQGWH